MTDIEPALRHHLDDELNRLQPHPVPTEAVYSRARAIRHTRRAWAAGALATAAVLGTSLPILGSGLRQSAAGGGNTVTVNTPHTDAKGRSVFSGSEGGRHWSVTIAPGECPSTEDFSEACNGAPANDPAEFGFSESTRSTNYAVFFRSDIARIDMTLGDGQEVTLLPATVRGNRVGLVLVPPKTAIARVDAYAADGSLVAYSIPFQTDGVAHFAMWYKPDQLPTQPEASGTITGTTPKGQKASVDVRIGPFGFCYTVAQRPLPNPMSTTNCVPLTSPGSDDVPPRNFDWVALGSRVDGLTDHVDYELNTGTIRVPVVHIGGYSFAVCFADDNFTFLGKTAYDASGHVLERDQIPAKP